MQSLQSISNTISNSSPNSPVAVKPSEQESFWGSDGFTFGDVVDMFNPMHHLPVISKYYREQTHDDASEGSRLVGGALFGGLIGGVTGLLTSVANSAIRHEAHQDMSEQLLAIAEEAIEDITSSPEKELLKSEFADIDSLNKGSAGALQSVSIEGKETNPFFAEMLREHSNEYYFSPELQNASIPRTREWGKV